MCKMFCFGAQCTHTFVALIFFLLFFHFISVEGNQIWGRALICNKMQCLQCGYSVTICLYARHGKWFLFREKNETKVKDPKLLLNSLLNQLISSFWFFQCHLLHHFFTFNLWLLYGFHYFLVSLFHFRYSDILDLCFFHFCCGNKQSSLFFTVNVERKAQGNVGYLALDILVTLTAHVDKIILIIINCMMTRRKGFWTKEIPFFKNYLLVTNSTFRACAALLTIALSC